MELFGGARLINLWTQDLGGFDVAPTADNLDVRYGAGVGLAAVKTLDYKAELKLLEGLIRRQARPTSTLRILEAGCGREWYFELDDIAHEITGVDQDSHALAFRKDENGDLDRGIVGDLLTVDLPSAYFDVIYSSFVLEHIKGAETALNNFVRWLRPGGLLIVRVPDISSVQTFLAKFLPRWCAILYYRTAWGIKNAGMPGFAPYPAFYDEVISSQGFHHYCSTQGLAIVDEMGVGTYSARGTGPFRYLLPVVAKSISLLSGGRVHDRNVDRTFVARKATDMPESITKSPHAAARRSSGREFFGLQAKPGA
jgi:SAM-dependent methyltransferase